MNLEIRPVCDDDVEDLVRLSLLAWAPVFSSFEQILGHTIYTLIWPGWRTGQRDAVETVCRDREKAAVLVAELDGRVVGFLAYELNVQDGVGDVTLLAVHPDYQNLGIGTELNNLALAPHYAAKLAELRSATITELRRTGAGMVDNLPRVGTARR